jgi:AcrR family transcriptional regulator
MAFSEPDSAVASSTARSLARDASRQRLIDAAVAVFAKKGFSAAKATDIAARAGVAVGTLYLHFGDKEGIARAVALEALGELRTRLRRAVERPGLTAQKAARSHATALVDFVSATKSQGRLLFAADSPGLRSEIFDAMAEAQEDHLRERGRDGYFRTDIDAAVAAQALVGMQSRVLMWWMDNRRRASRTAVIDTLAKIRFAGVHAHAGSQKKAASKSRPAGRKAAAKSKPAKPGTRKPRR